MDEAFRPRRPLDEERLAHIKGSPLSSEAGIEGREVSTATTLNTSIDTDEWREVRFTRTFGDAVFEITATGYDADEAAEVVGRLAREIE